MTLNVKCDILGTELNEPGALLFGPPDEKGFCEKVHLSSEGYELVLEFIADKWIEAFFARNAPAADDEDEVDDEEVEERFGAKVLKAPPLLEQFRENLERRLTATLYANASPRTTIHNVSGVSVAMLMQDGTAEIVTPKATSLEIAPVRIGAELDFLEDEINAYAEDGRLTDFVIEKSNALLAVIRDQHVANYQKVKDIQPGSAVSHLTPFKVKLALDPDSWTVRVSAVSHGTYYALPPDYREARPLNA